MDKLLLNGVGTLGSVGSTYIVGLISFIIIGVSLLIILYRIVKWMSRLDDMMTSLVAQTYIQQQKEKEEAEGNDKNSLISIDDSSKIIEVKDATIVVKNKKDTTTSKLGYHSAAINIARYSIVESTGDYSVAVATSEKSSAKVEGKDSIAIVCGTNGKASGRLGCWLILTERGEWNGKEYTLKDVKSIKVDGKKIKEDTWYKLENGEIIEVGSSKETIT